MYIKKIFSVSRQKPKTTDRMRRIGYTTATCDVIHHGHISLLKRAASMCDHLIVGLTTDRLARIQKRAPLCSFQSRVAVVEELACVGTVVPHDGASKVEAHRALNFDCLFIGDDYLDSEEYNDFRARCPHVPVFFLPRTPDISTTQILKNVQLAFLNTSHIVVDGIYGPVTGFVCADSTRIVTKTASVGKRERFAKNGRNVYGITYPLPRNWKTSESQDLFPAIGGVNAFREIAVHETLKDKAWNPVLYTKLIYRDSQQNEAVDLELGEGGVALLLEERARPAEKYWIVQRHAGKTLDAYMREKEQLLTATGCAQVFKVLHTKICDQINELKEEGIVHGDLHARNICVDDAGTVSFIDFGWCLSRSFCLDAEEREDLESSIADDFDRKHFEGSLHCFDLKKYL